MYVRENKYKTKEDMTMPYPLSYLINQLSFKERLLMPLQERLHPQDPQAQESH